MRRRIVLLGSTGSIGHSALSVIDRLAGRFEVVALGAHKNVDLLLRQVERYHPGVICLVDEDAAARAAECLRGTSTVVVSGLCGLNSLVESSDVDLVINALVGSVGLIPTVKALDAGKDVAMANKEALVMAGRLLTDKARAMGVHLLPLDSEPSALWQCMNGNGTTGEVRKIMLTASGGPFRNKSPEELAAVTVEETLRHPTWRMGKKITVDSATLMNKGLEVIEAHNLFRVPLSEIEVVIHPQSIVHSFVEFVDGSVIAQLSNPDMRLPIQYALTYPDRLPSPVNALSLTEIGSLTFEPPDMDAFPSLGLCYSAAEEGGTATAVLNAANEVAVEAFLAGRIQFPDIPALCRDVLDACPTIADPDLEQILHADALARETAKREVEVLPC